MQSNSLLHTYIGVCLQVCLCRPVAFYIVLHVGIYSLSRDFPIPIKIIPQLGQPRGLHIISNHVLYENLSRIFLFLSSDLQHKSLYFQSIHYKYVIFLNQQHFCDLQHTLFYTMYARMF